MGIHSICLVKAKIKPLKEDGTTEAEIVVPYYFRGSGVYKNSTGVRDASGIKNVPYENYDGSIPLTPVADLIRAGILDRVNVTVRNESTKKKYKYSLIIDAENAAIIYDKTSGQSTLDGDDWILPTKTGTKNVGKIIRVGSRTEAYNP
jgi:hypothetical protein